MVKTFSLWAMIKEMFAVMPGFQFVIGIGHADDTVIGDDVVRIRRRVADLYDFAIKIAIRIRVHREIHALALHDPAGVRFGHAGINLHPRQIIRDLEKCRRAETGSHCLAQIHRARNHDAIHRRYDFAVTQIDVCIVERSLIQLHCGLSLVTRGHGGVIIRA